MLDLTKITAGIRPPLATEFAPLLKFTVAEMLLVKLGPEIVALTKFPNLPAVPFGISKRS